MCYALYAGANHELPLTDPAAWDGINVSDDGWEERSPRLTVTRLREGDEITIQLFDEAFVVDLGSYGGCGCGFAGNDEISPTTPVNSFEKAARESRQALAEYVQIHHVMTLYFCWTGDESLSSEGEREITLSQLKDSAFPLPERVRMRVRTSGEHVADF